MNVIVILLVVAVLLVAVLWLRKRNDGNNSPNSEGNGGNSHQTSVNWVDLGLPSGLLWADRNMGASSPEDYGSYYAWGETEPKRVYCWDTYRYAYGAHNLLTKYCNDSDYGYNGFTDNLTTLQPDDDAATANLGNGARTPTKEDWEELISNTTSTWTTQNGVNGKQFTASNGNSLFLPAAGCRWGGVRGNTPGGRGWGSQGYYWSSLLDTDNPTTPWYFLFNLSDQHMDGYGRIFGFTVRAVRSN